MELQKNDQSSKYFKDETKEELDFMRKIKYMETVPCVVQESYLD